MESIASFGFVTGCHIGDKFHVQASLASIQHYCPGVPTCLVVDGTFDVSDLVEQYQVIVLRIPELPSAEMRGLISRNYRAKLAAMWEGPFDFYVWIDADAICWGDIRPFIRKDLDFQIFWKEAPQTNNEIQPEQATVPTFNGFKHYYFDYDILKKFDPEFQWQGNTYFCSGAFACRKNVISFEEWKNIESWKIDFPSLFRFGEQGILNYAVHAKAQRGELNVLADDLQHIWSHHGKEELELDCLNNGWKWPQKIARPRVAHFCGRKPNILDRNSYSRPFTIARLEHYRYSFSNSSSWQRIFLEDSNIYWKKMKKKYFSIL